VRTEARFGGKACDLSGTDVLPSAGVIFLQQLSWFNRNSWFLAGFWRFRLSCKGRFCSNFRTNFSRSARDPGASTGCQHSARQSAGL